MTTPLASPGTLSWAGLGAVWVASLLGSLHCVAMCGPLAGLAVGGAQGRARRWLAAWHSLGRLGVYVVIGGVAGAIGASFERVGQWVQIQRLAMIVAGGLLLLWGAYHVAVALGATPVSWRNPALGRALVKIQRTPPTRRALSLGALSGALPCGWLWSFAIAAAGTGYIARGALVMAVFWLGTVPAMVGALAAVAPAVRYLRARMPLVTAIVITALGLATLYLRAPLLARSADGPATMSCHRGGR